MTVDRTSADFCPRCKQPYEADQSLERLGLRLDGCILSYGDRSERLRPRVAKFLRPLLKRGCATHEMLTLATCPEAEASTCRVYSTHLRAHLASLTDGAIRLNCIPSWGYELLPASECGGPKVNRHSAAEALLQEIVRWSAATGTPETTVGHALFLHPGFVGALRVRLTVTEEKEQLVRKFLTAHPDGFHDALPKTRIPRTAEVASPVRSVSREPCPKCAIRSDIGCRHQPRLAS